MKKIYILLVMVFLSAGAFAQFKNGQLPKLRTPLSVPAVPHNSSRSSTSIWIDYDSADAYVWNAPAGSNNRFIWLMSKSYNRADGDSFNYDVNNCIVRFDSLIDVNNGNNPIDRSTVTSITVDSIYTFLGHSNTSGTNDTIIVKILNLDASRYPGTTTLWADTTVVDTSLSPDGNWLRAQYLQWNPNYTHNMRGFAVELDFYGDRTMDTCGFLAGFHNHGACGTDAGPFADTTSFPNNSYAYWTQFNQIVPTPTGGDIYYDCNNNNAYDAGTDATNFLQNIFIGAWITVNTGVGIHEDLKTTGIGLYQNVPNPLHNSTDIRYELANNAKDVSLSVYDIVGNKVAEVKEGNKSAGKYTIQLDAAKLAKGMYTYTLRVDGSQLTKRMIVE